MMKQFIQLGSAFLCTLLIFTACQSDTKEPHADVARYDNGYEIIQTQLLEAEPGEVIDIPAGIYACSRSLSLEGIEGVTIRGAGVDKTVLSFKNQTTGSEGLRVTANNITLQDFTVEDSKGDAIKLQDCQGVQLVRIKTTWTDGAKATNGGYGLYPVQCEDVVVDDCEASFASDAGIYVGQSRRVLVKNSYAHQNVAGIEIENCIDAEVVNNLAENNSGGILVFDLPDLELTNGHTCKVHDNQIIGNNHKNFAAEGNIVATVPPGTGIILMAAKKVDVFENRIIDHKTMGIAITSYQLTQLSWKDTAYDPYTHDVKIYKNVIERKATIPDISKEFGQMVNMLFPGKPQDIIYDGITREGATGENPMNICISENEVPKKLRFANIDAANEFDNVDKSLEPYACL